MNKLKLFYWFSCQYLLINYSGSVHERFQWAISASCLWKHSSTSSSPLLIKKGLFLHCLYCCALLWRRLVLHPGPCAGQAGSQACSMQHPPPICWAAAKTRIFLSQHKQTCSMGALLDISCQARLLHSNTYVWLRHRPDRQTFIQLRSFIQYIVGRV